MVLSLLTTIHSFPLGSILLELLITRLFFNIIIMDYGTLDRLKVYLSVVPICSHIVYTYIPVTLHLCITHMYIKFMLFSRFDITPRNN